MNRNYLLLIIVLFFIKDIAKVNGQVAAYYNFSQSNETYIPITGGTTVAVATNTTAASDVSLDQGNYTVNIPFNFNFNGTNYTSCNVNTNGYITFGSVLPIVSLSIPISSTTAYSGAVAAMAKDIWGMFGTACTRTISSVTVTGVTNFTGVAIGKPVSGTGISAGATIISYDQVAGTITLSAPASATSTNTYMGWPAGEIKTETIGIAPDRKCVIQFSGMSDVNAQVPNDINMSFQIVLAEGGGASTAQSISVVYGPQTNLSAFTRTHQVGLRGALSSDFNNRSSSTSWISTTAGLFNNSNVARSNLIFPPSGLTFTWTPVFPCNAAPVPGNTLTTSVNLCSGSPFTLSLQNNPVLTGFAYQWKSSLSGFVSDSTIINGATSISLQTTQSATTYYRCQVTCSNSGLAGYSIPVQLINQPMFPAGTYTINSTIPTGGTNFQSFADVISAISCGIAGPLIFNVNPSSGPYTEQIILPAISGTSATNTITFNGNGRTIIYNPVNSNERAVIKLNGADFITFDNFSIVSTSGSYGYGIQMMNNADNNTISHCDIVVNSISTSSSEFVGIVINSSPTTIINSGASLCDSNTIANNTISGGYAGVVMAGNSSASFIYKNRVVNNSIKDFHIFGIYLNGGNGTLIEGNDISRPTRTVVSTFNGIFLTAVSLKTNISKNRLHNPFGNTTASASSVNCIYLNSCIASSGNENVISNNLIYDIYGTTGNHFGIVNNLSTYAKYFHNTIFLNDSNATCTSCAARGISQQGTTATALSFVNNIVKINQGGTATKACIFFETANINNCVLNGNDYLNTSVSGFTNEIARTGGTGGIGYNTIASWKAASNQEANSVSIDPLFLNLPAGNLKPSGLAFGLDNVGIPVGITSDIVGVARSVINPDAGAYEFTEAIAFNFSGLSINPPGGQCVAQQHHVSVNADTATSGMEFVRLIWSFNGNGADSIAMINTSGNIWEGNIPIPVPVNATVTWFIRGYDGSFAKTINGTSYQDNLFSANSLLSTVSQNSICQGDSVLITAVVGTQGTAVVGSGSIFSSTFSNPFFSSFSNSHNQYLITAAELHAAGLATGNISSLGVTLTSAGLLPMIDFSLKIGATNAVNMSSFISSPLTTVYESSSFMPMTGLNTMIFSSLFYWDGIQNLVIDICHGNPNSNASMSRIIQMDNTSYISTRHTHNTSSPGTPASVQCADVSTNVIAYSARPKFTFGGIVGPSGFTYSWTSSPAGNGLSTFTGSLVKAIPVVVGSYDYNVVATYSNGCTLTATHNVNVNQTPPVPLATSSTQCGFGLPAISVSGSGGFFKWYLSPDVDTTIQMSFDNTLIDFIIDTTTTFYIAESDGICESLRDSVSATVVQPDSVVATSSSVTTCIGSAVTLIANSTGNTNNYSFSWTAVPEDGSGLTGALSGQNVIVSPTAKGRFEYTVVAYDAVSLCNTMSIIAIDVYDPISITDAVATNSFICDGASVTLSSNQIGNGPVVIGIGSTISASYANPFYSASSNSHNQHLILASELTSSGLFPGNITSMGISIFAAGTLPMIDFSLKMGSTTATSLTTFLSPVFTTVYEDPSLMPVAGVNTITFTDPFYWDGISNVVIEICHGNIASIANMSRTAEMDFTPFISTIHTHKTNSSSGAGQCADITSNLTSFQSRPKFYFTGQTKISGAGDYLWEWTPGNISGNSIVSTPPTTTNFIVTATDIVSGCSASSSLIVTVLPIPQAPIAINSIQCGYGIPTCGVSGGIGSFNWYFDPTGGLPIANEHGSSLDSYHVSTTTTFYVAEFDGMCESSRTQVIAEVVQPDSVDALISERVVCPGVSVTLSVNQSATNNVYSFMWTSVPDIPESGISDSVAGRSIIIIPIRAGLYQYVVTATDVANVCVTRETIDLRVLEAPDIVSVSSSSGPSVCLGSSDTLSADAIFTGPGNVFIGTNTTTSSTYSNPFYSVYSNSHNQHLILAQELTSAGLAPGDITTVGFNVLAAGTIPMLNFSLKIGATSTSDLSGFVSSTFTTVYSTASFLPISGLNSITFSTPFTWDGVSNIVIEICHGNDASNASMTRTMEMENTLFHSTIHTHKPVPTSGSAVCSDLITNLTTYFLRPKFLFEGNVYLTGAGNYSWLWSPGNLIGNSHVVSPLATTTYVVTATNLSGCVSSRSIDLTVNPIPVGPNTTPSTQCGFGVPGIIVTGTGDYFNWYLTPSGGIAVQSSANAMLTSYSISSTTTFYVSQVSGVCEGLRRPAIATVTPGDSIFALVSDNTICLNDSVRLIANKTGSSNNYLFSWSAIPETGSGITGYIYSDSVFVKPTLPGIYTYILKGIDSIAPCNSITTVNVSVQSAPSIVNVSALPSILCNGNPTTLSANASDGITDDVFLGTGSSVTTSAGISPYSGSTEGVKTQYLILKTELSAAGFVPGNISAIKFNVSSVQTTVSLKSYSIKFCNTNAADLSGNFVSGNFQTVFGPVNILPVAGLNNYVLNSPFYWDGNSNIVIDICFDNDPSNICNTGGGSCFSNSSGIFYSNTAFVSVRGEFGNNNSGLRDMCNTPSGTLISGTSRPNIILTGIVSADVTSSMTWQWNPGNMLGNSVSPIPSAGTTIYSVTSASSNGCQATSTVSVNSIITPPLPVISATSDSVCLSGTVTLTYANPVSGATVQWQESSDSINWTNIAAANSLTYITPVLIVTTYYRVQSGCLSNVNSFAKRIFVATPAILATTGTTRCGAGLATISVNGTGSIDWFNSTIGGVSLNSGNTYTPLVTVTTTFFAQASVGSCLNSGGRIPVYVIVTPSQGIQITSSPGNSVCSGQAVTLTASSTNDPLYNYYWSTDGYNTISTGSVFSVNPFVTTTYYAVAIDSNAGPNFGCGAVATKLITANPYPVQPIISPSSPAICQIGAVITLTAIGSTANFVWSPGSHTGSSINVSPSVTTVFTVTASLATGCSVTSAPMTIVYAPIAPVTISPSGPTTFCQGGNVTLNASSGYLNYQWSAGGGANQSFVATPLVTTAYTVTVNNGSVCTSSASTTVTVAPLAPPVITKNGIAVSANSFLCQGEIATLNAGSGYNSYSWSDGTTVVGNSQNYSTTSTGTYSVIVSSAFGCTAESTVILSSAPNPSAPSVTLIGDSTICDDGSETILLDANGPYPGFDMMWNDFNNSNIEDLIVSGNELAFIANSDPFGFSLTITNQITGCYATSPAIVIGTNPCGIVLNSNIIIEGYYSLVDGLMDNPNSIPAGGCLFQSFVAGAAQNDVDTVFISVMDPVTFAEVDRQWGILQTDGSIYVKFSTAVISGSQYYLRINHRNTVEMWSSLITISGPAVTYLFSNGTGVNDAWFNMKEIAPGVWAVYSGDIANDFGIAGTQNGYIDAADFVIMDSDIQSGVSGYFSSDLDGDGFVTAVDFLILEPHIQEGIGRITPP